MKKTTLTIALCLAFLWSFAQFPNAPSKVVQGRQTTALGIINYSNAAPNYTPANWRNDTRVSIDTLLNITGTTTKAQRG